MSRVLVAAEGSSGEGQVVYRPASRCASPVGEPRGSVRAQPAADLMSRTKGALRPARAHAARSFAKSSLRRPDHTNARVGSACARSAPRRTGTRMANSERAAEHVGSNLNVGPCGSSVARRVRATLSMPPRALPLSAVRPARYPPSSVLNAQSADRRSTPQFGARPARRNVQLTASDG